MNKKLLLILFLGIFLISIVSAWSWSSNKIVSYYKFDETTGAVKDELNLNNGTAQNVERGVTGKFNNQFRFNSTIDSVNMTSFNGLSNTDMSACMWVNLTGQYTSINTLFHISNSTGFYLNLLFRNATYLELGIYDGATEYQKKDFSAYFNQSVYLCLDYNTTAMHVYINNVEFINKAITFTEFSGIDFLKIGNGDGERGTFGDIDEAVICNQTLTADERSSLYNEGAGCSYGNNNCGIVRPEVTLNSPADYYNTTERDITFNISVTDNLYVENVSLYLDGVLNETNTSHINGTYIFERTLSFGDHNWSIVAYDNESNANDPIVTRNLSIKNYILNSETYNSVTTETFTEAFGLNISLANGITLNSASFTYNGTSYSPTINSSGNFRILGKNIVIPSVSTATNISFYWTLNFNVESINTTEHNQTINSLSIDNCGVNTHIILNYTLFDEDSLTYLNASYWNTSSNIYIKISGDASGENYIYYSGEITTNPVQVCLNEAIAAGKNYRLDAEIQYSADDYVTEYNYIENYTLNTSMPYKNVSLYSLLVNRSQEFLITFKDSNLIPVEGALIEITRQYLELGQFKTIEISKTNIDGGTIGHLVLNDAIYTLYIKKNGELLATFENVRAFCSNILTGDCRINLNQQSTTTNPSNFLNYLGIIGSESYNDTTKVYSFEFTTEDSSTKTINVTMYKFDNYLNDTICTEELTSSSGTITCTIPSSYYNNTALVKIYVDSELYSSNIFDITISKSSELSPTRWILAFLLIVTLPLLAVASGPMTIIMFILGLVLAGGLALIDWGGFVGPFSAFLWIVIAAIIIMMKASNRREQY